MEILKNKIIKILNSKNIFDIDFYFCDTSKIGENDYLSHTEAQECASQILCVSFTFNNFLTEIGVDKNIEENLTNMIENSQVQINETRALEIASSIHDIFKNKSMKELKLNKKKDSSLFDCELYLSRN